MLARFSVRPPAASLVLAAIAACSTVPSPSFPEFVDHHVAADFVVSPNGRLRLPSTTRSLVVHEVALSPAPVREHFDESGRWFEYPAGTAVQVQCRLRAYAAKDGRVPTLPEILVDANRIATIGGP